MRRAVGPGLLALGLLAPFVPLLAWAVAGGYGYPALLPSPSPRGAQLLAAPTVVEAAVTSVLVGVVVAVLATAAGTAAGRALGGHRFRGRGIVAAVLVTPVVVPALATTLGIQVFFVRYGLSDTVAGVVLVQLVPAVPYASLVMAAAFARLDPGLEDQARMLGAGGWQRARHVVAPAVAPALAVAALFTFLISWSEYILTLLIGGGTVRTLPLLLFAAIGSGDLPAAAALSLALALPPLLLVGFTARRLAGPAATLRHPIAAVRP